MDAFYYVLLVFAFLYISCIVTKAIDDCENRRPARSILPIENITTQDIESSINTYEMVEGESVICPITQDYIEEGEKVKELPCGHIFSEDISKWIKIKNICPVCREKVISVV